MTIHFYLNNEEETEITSFYDLQSNPFALNDIISINVDELYPVDINKFGDRTKEALIEKEREIKELFRFKKIKIVSENKYINIKVNEEPKLTIEYHCNVVEE
jgi:hypothetical protein